VPFVFLSSEIFKLRGFHNWAYFDAGPSPFSSKTRLLLPVPPCHPHNFFLFQKYPFQYSGLHNPEVFLLDSELAFDLCNPEVFCD